MSFSITPIGIILILGLIALTYKDFFREKRLATANGASFVFKDCLKKFYIDVFYLYVCVVLFTNLGYFVKIGSYYVGYSFVLSLVLFCVAIILIFSERLYDKKLMLIGGVFILSCVIGLILAYMFPYKGGYIQQIDQWDLYFFGEAEKVYSISPSFAHFNNLFSILRYSIILSVTKKTLSSRRLWDKLLDIINIVTIIIIIYGFFEIFSNIVLGRNPVDYFFNPLFGKAEATSVRTDRCHGTYKESSHYALYLFFILIFEMFYIFAKKDNFTPKRLIVEYIKMAALTLLMMLSTAFSALILLLLLYILFVRYIINPKNKLVWILCSVAVVSCMLAIISNGTLSRKLGIGELNERFNSVINVLYQVLSGKNVESSSIGIRFTSMFEMMKIFAARPFFGIGIGITDAHTIFFSILASTGIVGTVLWIAVILNFGEFKTNNIIFGIVLFISILFVGSVGFITYIILPVLFYYIGMLFPSTGKNSGNIDESFQ